MSLWAGAAPFVVGHRGGRGEGWPAENTLDAFERARRQGAQAVELDTRVSAEGEAVVFHDPVLTRMTSRRDLRRVSDVALRQLCDIDLGAGARIPKLADVLAWARACGLGVNVELKRDVPRRGAVVRAAARAVRESGADVLLSSFDPAMLAMAAVAAPSVARALLTHDGQPRWAWALQRMLGPPLVSALHLERTQVGSGSIARDRSRTRIGVWTVNSPPEAADLVRRGAAWIITDAPGEVLEGIRSQPSVR